MKQRIITGVVAAAFFIPFVIYGQLPFTLLVYAMATVAMFELLRMKKMSVFSIPGFVGFLTVYVLLMPDSWADKVHEVTSYSKLEFLVIAALLLLIHSVIVKTILLLMRLDSYFCPHYISVSAFII